ncbi:MAG: hypothetical protein AAF604_07135 [Acidobacteriota bacterium]
MMPNLAREPFVNARPVVRITSILWVLGVSLALLAAGLYWSYFSGREDQRERLIELEAQIDQEKERIAALQEELGLVDLENQNESIDYLNERISERTFGWSLLFDRLSDILPADVRLLSLNPAVERQQRRSNRRRQPARDSEKVVLRIQAIGRSDGAMEQLIDRLFSDLAFENPNPYSESRDAGQSYFSLDVVYLPRVAAEQLEQVAESSS